MSPAGAPAGDRSTGARFAACVAETIPATTTAAASELVDLRRTAQSRCSLHIRRASRGRGACSPPAHASSSPVSEIESGREIVNATGDLNEAKERIGSDARTHIVATLTGAREQIRMLIEDELSVVNVSSLIQCTLRRTSDLAPTTWWPRAEPRAGGASRAMASYLGCAQAVSCAPPPARAIYCHLERFLLRAGCSSPVSCQ